ncbi:MAG TPA: response regulator transcription factor [Edaphocola sp.]|nr:response regulator transcription factor [Edaphocola sp.]
MNILVIEDDKRISDFLLKGLQEAAHIVNLAGDGNTARSLINENQYDIILMDIMLPDIDGLQLTQLIRYKNNHTPILVLSALNEPEDKIKILDLGADDYLTKPFHFQELLSRINALTRRNKLSYTQSDAHIQSCGSIKVDTNLHKAFQFDKEIELSPREFKLLSFLIQNKNKTVGRSAILSNVWGLDFDTSTNIVDVYISYVRNKIDESEEKLIHTVKGVGYLMKD